MAYLEVELVTSETQLYEEFLAKLKEELEAKGIVGWEPAEGNLEVIQGKVIAGMAQAVALQASVVPSAIFRKFGTELLGVQFNEGVAAKAKAKFTIHKEPGIRQIPQGTNLEAGGYGFMVETETEVPSESTEVTVPIVAIELGTEYNGITGIMQLVNPISYVTEVQLVGETTGGVNEETDAEYQTRLASLLALQAPRPITASNFAEFTLDIPANIIPGNVEVGRATCIDGYSPEIIKIEAKTNSSTTLTEVSTFTGVSLEKTVLPQKHPGSELHWEADGAEFKVLVKGTTAVSKIGAAEMKISVAALKSEAKGKIEVIGKYEEERTVTVFVTNKEGKELTSPQRTAIKEYLEKYRELNFRIFVENASYNPIFVTTKIHVLPGFTVTAVEEQVKAAVVAFLSPETWGNPEGKTTGANTWLNATEGYNVLRYNQVLGAIEKVPGVAYVLSGSTGLKTGIASTPSGTADITMVGPAPLPECPTAHVLVSSE